MAKRCPIYGSTVLYLDCLECEEKRCKQNGRVTSEVRNKSIGHATRQEVSEKDKMDKTSEVW